MIAGRRAGWLWVAFVAPIIVLGILAMHGLSGSHSIPERAGHPAHGMTSPRHHEMPSKSARDHVHDIVLCVWLLVAGFALVALRKRVARLSEIICVPLQSIASPGRALMRAPPVSVRLSLVGLSRR